METTKKQITVGEVIESLKQFDPNAPFEIAVSQMNKTHPVAYCKPLKSVWEGFASMRNGQTVRMEIMLPHDEKTYMFVSTKKFPKYP